MNKIYIITYGCAMNQSDSEVIAGHLKKAGFQLVKSETEAELVVVNSCIVKGPTESKVLDYLRKIDNMGKKIVVAGCMPQALPEKLRGYSLLGVDHLSHICEIVEEALHDNTVVLIAKEKNPRLNIPKIRRNEIIEIIPICAGCLGNCSYCIVKRARGELFSYDKKAIIEQVLAAIAQGAKEIWLTAQDTGCYGKDIGETLPSLLNSIIKLPDNFKVRLGMLNPNYVKEYLDELIQTLKSEKMFRFIHIPVQAGSNEILKKMNRKYKAEDFIEIVERLRKEQPDLTISTDIICGFPGETDEQFLESIRLIERTKPDILNISRFWKRPHTKAARMKQLTNDVIQSRSRRMTSVFEWIAFENQKKWAGWEGEILIDEQGKDGTWIGRNFAYRQVILEGDYRIGDKVSVKVTSTTFYDLRAKSY